MRGVPLAITSCIALGLPLADPFDRTGPYCTLLSCGLAWQTRHDWLNRCSPCRWVSLRSCAKAGVAASASAIGQAFDHACRMSFLPFGLVAHVPAKPALGLDPRVVSGSPTRTCATFVPRLRHAEGFGKMLPLQGTPSGLPDRSAAGGRLVNAAR